VAFAEGHGDEALAELRRAADREDTEGGDSISVPAREMLADLLLELKRPLEAIDAYKAVLASSPHRFDALFGAAQASRAAGDNAAATDYFRQLLGVAAPDAKRPEIAYAKAAIGL
jgi:tetratricopeptide (TPR) repeat protein